MTRARLSRVMTPRRIRRRHKLRSAEMAEQVQTQEGGLRERVEQVLDTIRPYIQGDGGDIALLDVTDGVVQIRLPGACLGCVPSMMTLPLGVDRMLNEAVPELTAGEATPFYHDTEGFGTRV